MVQNRCKFGANSVQIRLEVQGATPPIYKGGVALALALHLDLP